MPFYIRLLLIYAAAMCLTLSLFALAPLVGPDFAVASRSVVPWLLVLGGVLGAFDCWRLSRSLQRKMDAHTRDVWLPRQVVLFARRGSVWFMIMLGSLTLAAVVLFAGTVGTPHVHPRAGGQARPVDFRPAPAPAPTGEAMRIFSDEDREKILHNMTIPAKDRLRPRRVTIGLLTASLFGFLGALGYFSTRRDGRASLVLDAHGIDHHWIGRVAWTRVRGLGLAPMNPHSTPGLALLVDHPGELLDQLPMGESGRQKALAARRLSPGEIVLALHSFDADPKRVLSAARRIRADAATPMLDGWAPGMSEAEIQALFTTHSSGAPGTAMRRPPTALLPAAPATPRQTGKLVLSLGDRVSIAWVSVVSLLGAFQLFAMALFGYSPWQGS